MWRPTEQQIDLLSLHASRRHGLDWAVTRAKIAQLIETSVLCRSVVRLALWLDSKHSNPKFTPRSMRVD